MKLIATAPFRNNLDPRIEIEGALHPDHIHRGAVFIIGRDKAGKSIDDEEQLSKIDANNIRLLTLAKCIGSANDEKLVKQVAAEVAEEKAREANQKTAQARAGTPESVLASLLGLSRPAGLKG